MDFGVCYPAVGFDRRSIMWDLNYFKYCFLKATRDGISGRYAEDDFNRLTDVLLEASQGDTFMYRDFQSRNVMIREGEPWFIDFQGGRRGPFYYDVASFLWQAKANLPEGLRRELLDVYLESLNKYTPISRKGVYGASRCDTSYFSARCRCSEHTALGDISRRSRISCRVCLSLLPSATASARTLCGVSVSQRPSAPPR